ncbi:hypothetical protein ACFLU6_09460, partial [Acidobacteriota bacterium]
MGICIKSILSSMLCLFILCPGVYAGRGGPDSYGYSWLDDTEPDAYFERYVHEYYKNRDFIELYILSEDQVIADIDIGFEFPYYGNIYDRLTISTNGWLSFLPQADAYPDNTGIPDPSAPSGLLAPFWDDLLPVADAWPGVSWGSDPQLDLFFWEYNGFQQGTGGDLSFSVFLFPTGEIKIRYRRLIDDISACTVGIESPGGTDGLLCLFDGNAAPGFSFAAGRMLHFVPPVRLLDSNPLTLPCNGLVSSAGPSPADPLNAFHYPLVNGIYAGSEVLYRIDLTEDSELDLTLQNFGSRNLSLFLLRSLSEMDCLAGGGARISVPYLPAGTYYVSVDAVLDTDEGSFDLRTACRPIERLSCSGLPVSGLGLKDQAFDYQSCTVRDVTAPQKVYDLFVPAGARLGIDLDTAADLGLFLFERDDIRGESCLGGGGKFLRFTSDSDRNYLLLVSAYDGQGGGFDVTAYCDSANPLASAALDLFCGTADGTTATASSAVHHYNCEPGFFSGSEALYSFTNPLRQPVSLRLLDAAAEMSLFLLSSRDPSDCIEGGSADIQVDGLEPGRYFVVVDGVNGVSGSFKLELNLQACPSSGTDLVVVGAGLSNVVEECEPPAISGTAEVDVLNQGVNGISAPFSAAIFEDLDGDRILNPVTDIVLGETSYSGPLPAGQTARLSIPFSGSLTFRGVPLHTAADSGSNVPEDMESNNTLKASPPCLTGLPPPSFTGQRELVLTHPNVLFDDLTPVAVLSPAEDQIPSIIFTSETNDRKAVEAVRGSDGAAVFFNDFNMISFPIAADVTLDGKVETIIQEICDTTIDNWFGLHVFDSDGNRLFTTDKVPLFGYNRRRENLAIALSDLDRDGSPEMVISDTIFNSQGGLVHARYPPGMLAAPEQWEAIMPLASDLDLQGDKEIIYGNMALRSDLSLFWQKVDPNHPFFVGPNTIKYTSHGCAVANVDGDPEPELLVQEGAGGPGGSRRLFCLNHDGTENWVYDPGPPSGNATTQGCTVADIDGDGRPEVLSLIYGAITAFSGDGGLLWQYPCNPNTPLSLSAFDFHGDGAMEIVFKDFDGIGILDGTSGTLLFFDQIESWSSMGSGPVIADVDGDGRAEIVAISGKENLPNLIVYGNPTWWGTRKIWNQESYSITNINDDGTVPED